MSIGHSPDEPQYAPDMPKKQENITQAEKQEAKRRIEGNATPQVSDDPSSSNTEAA